MNMRKLNFTKVIMLIVFALSPMVFNAQNEVKVEENKSNTFNDYMYVSGDLGLGILNGDNSGKKISLNGHLGIGYQFDNILGVKANFGFGGLNGKYSNITIDKLNYFEANVNMTINLTDIILGYNPDRKFSVVPHLGIGQLRYKVQTIDGENNVVYENGYHERHGRKVVATIPMGIEFNYIINPNWRVHLDFTTNYTDTDLIDGVASGSNDWFSTLNLGASYKLNSKANIFKREDPYCNYWYLMADGGASFLFGDYKYSFSDIRGNMNVGVGYDFHNFYRIYAKLGYGIYNGKHGEYLSLDYADYYTANVNIAADLVGFIFGYNAARPFGVYAHIGFGQMQYKARATFADGNKEYVGYNHSNKGNGLQDRKVALTVPVGLEFNYIINNTFDAYADVTTNYVDSDILDASYSGKHNDWHTTVNFGLRYKLNKACYMVEEDECCVTQEEIKQTIQDALKEHEANKPQPDTVVEVKYVDRYHHTNSTNIAFPINSSETEVGSVSTSSMKVQNGYEVESIVVEGYASPDGSKEINDRLSEERANVAADIVKNEIDAANVTIQANGADWDGLIKAILDSDINNRKEIATELRNSTDREQTLKELVAEYPEIKDLYPQLRRANVIIKTVK